MLSLKVLGGKVGVGVEGKNHSWSLLASSVSRESLVFLAYRGSTPISASVVNGSLRTVCLCSNFPLLLKTSIITQRPILFQYDLLST